MQNIKKTMFATMGSGLALAAVMSAPALANNQATKPGATAIVSNGNISPDGCAVNWKAESVDSTDASKYPAGLLTKLDGTPVNGGAAGGNGGYVYEVSPDLYSDPQGAPGLFEINHFSAGKSDIKIRIPVATRNPIDDAKITVTLPKLPSGATWALSDPENIGIPSAKWGQSYAGFSWSAMDFSWQSPAPQIPANGGTVTLDLGAMGVDEGRVLQFTADDATPADRDALSDYTAMLSGNYTNCTAPQPSSWAKVVKPGVPETKEVVTVKPAVPAHTEVVSTGVKKMAVVQFDTFNTAYAKGAYLYGAKKPLAAAKPLTAAQLSARDTARRADKAAGKLVYRSGSAATTWWGSSTSVVKTVNLCDMPKLAANQDAWVVDTAHGASTKALWGKNGKVAQLAPNFSGCTKTVVVPAQPAVTKTIIHPAVPPVYEEGYNWTCVGAGANGESVTTTKNSGCLTHIS